MNTVTRDNWSVSTTTGHGIEGAILCVSKERNGKRVRGDADGMRFPSSDAAFQYAFEHGYTQEFVKPWCRKCRTRHQFMGKRSAWCSTHSEFVR